MGSWWPPWAYFMQQQRWNPFVKALQLKIGAFSIFADVPRRQNRYFSKDFNKKSNLFLSPATVKRLFLMISIKNRYFFDPAARGSRLALASAIEIDTFLKEFNEKSIYFRLPAVPDPPRASNPLLFLMILTRNRYFFDPRPSPIRPEPQNRYFS